MRQAREATTSISRWPSGDLSMFARISPRLLVVPRSASRCQFIRPHRVVSRHWSLRAA
jgi:hypothetical protein